MRAKVRLKPDATTKRREVRLKPDTTYADDRVSVSVSPCLCGPWLVRLKPDTTYVLPRNVRCLWNGRFDLCAELGRDFRIKAEPCFPRRTHLVQQHAEPVDGRVSASLRGCEQRCVHGHIHDVAHQCRGRELVEREVERRLTDHPLAGRVDQHCCAVQRQMPLVPGERRHGWPEFAGQAFGTWKRPIDHSNIPRATI